MHYIWTIDILPVQSGLVFLNNAVVTVVSNLEVLCRVIEINFDMKLHFEVSKILSSYSRVIQRNYAIT